MTTNEDASHTDGCVTRQTLVAAAQSVAKLVTIAIGVRAFTAFQ